MKLTLLASLFLVTLVLGQCPANFAIPNLVSDSVLISVAQPTANQTQTYRYTLANVLPSSPSVAVALQEFTMSSFVPHAFYIAPSQVSSSVIVFTFAYTTPCWTKVRFNFWASSTPEVQLGNFGARNLNVLSNTAEVSTSLKQAFGSNDKPVVRVFINGYMADANGVQIAVSPSNLQDTQLSIKVMFGSTTKINNVWLSYVAFSPSTASFAAFGGSFERSGFQGSTTQQIQSSIYQTPYKLFGLSKISLMGIQSMDFRFDIGSDFMIAASASSNFDSLGAIYVIAGVAPRQLCAACSGKIAHGNVCVSSCPAGTSLKSFADGGQVCIGTASSGSSTSSVFSTASTSAQTVNVQTMPVYTAPSSSTQQTSQTAAQTSAQSSTQSSQASSGKCPDNSFFNGYECVCEVGYGYIGGKCIALSIIQPIPVIIKTQTTSSNQGSMTNSNQGSQTQTSQTQSQTQSQTTQTTQTTTTQTINRQNVSPVMCPSNGYDNGLGTCVCETGFYFSNGICVRGTPCGTGSTRQADGSCKCDAGLTNYGGVCSRCPSGAIYSTQGQTCIYVCGQNSIYDTVAGKCVCNPNYAIFNGVCDTCPQNYFVSSGYCVTCPVNSVLSPVTKRCECSDGFFTNQAGICARKCGTNEVYDSNTQQCLCIQGLGRVSGICTVCPSGSTPTADGSGCNMCQANEELVSGKCVCKKGFAYNSGRVCTICSSLPNGFLINGYCSVCPKDLIYNGNNGCICPQGKVLQGATCVSQCQADEITDANGDCFTCGANQVISNGQCVCKTGYAINSCGICTLSCPNGHFPFMGGCAVCPLNTVFKAEINGCGCPTGFYKDNFGVCAKIVLRPVDCTSGQYFDSNLGCVSCPGSCKTCSSATQCTSCATTGYAPNNAGVCVSQCGDGLIVGTETCDTGNIPSAGCSGCRIQTGWTCSGQPSVCRSNTPVTPTAPTTPTTPTVPTTPSTPTTPTTPTTTTSNLYQFGAVNLNSNNLFITLKTRTTFTFKSDDESQKFIKTSFRGSQAPTVYCSQRANPELDTFDCLMIYPSGVPNGLFSIDFSFNYQGQTGSTTVNVDPFAVANARANSRRRQ